VGDPSRVDPVALARQIGERIEPYATVHDRNGTFVAEGYAALRESRAPLLWVPAELGGRGASLADAVAFHAELARWCPSTSLAFAMHTHAVLTHAWRWRHRIGADRLLRAVADGIVVSTSGASDFLRISTRATVTATGWRVNGRKRFVSGCPGADWLVTAAAVEDGNGQGGTVLSFTVPFRRAGVEILDTWDSLGMRGSGSHDVMLHGVEISHEEGAAWTVGAPGTARVDGGGPRTPVVGLVHAMPVLAAVYWGTARAARDQAVASVAGAPRANDPAIRRAIGSMDAQLRTAWWSIEGLLGALGDDPPATEASYLDAMLAKRHAVLASCEVADLALDVVGGAAQVRGLPLERSYRDVRAAKTHPLTPEATLSALGEAALRHVELPSPRAST
jgi:acyl-CoA dehydrogenase